MRTISLLLVLLSTCVNAADWYSSPSGLATNTGTIDSPLPPLWSTIKLVSPTGRIKPGDTIYLKAGDHGSIRIAGPGVNIVSTEKATMSGVLSYGCNAWQFNGIKFIKPGLNPQYTYFIRLDSSNDITITNCEMCSDDDITAWTDDDWKTKSMRGISISGNRNTITHNYVHNVSFGIGIGGDGVALTDNWIDYFLDDGIDVLAQNCTVARNRVTNHYHTAWDLNHNDGIQCFVTAASPVRENLIIDSNVVLESDGRYSTIPPVPSGTGTDMMQGITCFDGTWTNVRVSNNVVACSLSHGISFYGCSNLTIEGNTLVRLGNNTTQNTWIGAYNGKKNNGDGTYSPILSTKVLVRNNITNFMNIGVQATVEHNVAFVPNGNAGPTALWKAGEGNVFLKTDIFKSYDVVNGKYDLHLKTPLYIGVIDSLDVEGKRRATSVGAYR